MSSSVHSTVAVVLFDTKCTIVECSRWTLTSFFTLARITNWLLILACSWTGTCCFYHVRSTTLIKVWNLDVSSLFWTIAQNIEEKQCITYPNIMLQSTPKKLFWKIKSSTNEFNKFIIVQKWEIYPLGFFPPLVTIKMFFKNRALSRLYPYGALTLGNKNRKN